MSNTSREITLEDVRNYILESGTMEEAESYLRTGHMTAVTKPNAPSNAVASIKDRIVNDRDAQREEIIQSLLSKKHEGALSMMQEEEEMKQLQLLEAKLREEHLRTETTKQQLALQLRDSKRHELDALAKDIEAELLQVEKQREQLEMNYIKKQSEIKALQDELHAAEVQFAEPPSQHRSLTQSTLTLQQHKEEMSRLTIEHAQRMAEHMNYAASVAQDQRRLQHGKIDMQSLTSHHQVAEKSSRATATPPASQASNTASAASLPALTSRSSHLNAMVIQEEEKLQQLLLQSQERAITPIITLPSAPAQLHDSLEKWLQNELPLEDILSSKARVDPDVLIKQIRQDVLKQPISTNTLKPQQSTELLQASRSPLLPKQSSHPSSQPREQPISSFFQRNRPSPSQIPHNTQSVQQAMPQMQQYQPQFPQYPPQHQPQYPYPHFSSPQYQNAQYQPQYPIPQPLVPNPYVQPPTPAPSVPPSYYTQLEQLANQLEAENKKYGAMLSDDSSAVSDNSKRQRNIDVTPRNQQPERLTKQDIQHRENLKAIQYQIECLQQTQILEELKVKLENEKAQRDAESKHNEWLNEQKRQLQALKITQALEQEKQKNDQLRNMTNTQTTTSTENTEALRLDTKPPKPQAIQFHLDGILLPRHMLAGEEYRLVTGFYDVDGVAIGRLQASNWTSWQNVNDGSKPDDVALEHCSVSRKIPKSKASTCPIKILVELQSRSSSNVQRPVAWALLGSYSVGEEGNVMERDGYYSDGCWRVSMRKGVADAKLPLLISLTDVSPAICLFRLTPASDKPVAAPIVSTVTEAQAAYKQQSPSADLKKPASATPSRPPTMAHTERMLRSDSKLPRAESRMPRSRPVTAESKDAKLEPTPSVSSLSSNNSLKLRSAVKGLQFLDRAQAESVGDAKDMQSITEKSDSGSDDEGVELLTNKHWQFGTPTTSPTERYQNGDGIDVYIDSGMHFPENCTVIRVVAKVLTNDCSVVGSAFESYSTLESTTVTPNFNFKVELRGAVFNVTNTLLIRVDTIDAVTLDTVALGYAALKIFCTRERKQPTQNNSNDVYINTGLFQLPLYGGRLKPGGVMNEERLVTTKMPKLPCSSLLVRIYSAPRSSDGLLILTKKDYPASDWERLKLHIPAPSYSSGAYDGRLCEPVAAENKAYDARSVCVMRSPEAAFVQAVSMWAEYDLPSHIKPKKPNNVINTATWLNSKMLPAATLSRVSKYQYVIPYSFEVGVQVSVEQLFNTPDPGLLGSKDVLYNVIYSCNPPGLFYRDLPLTEGVHFTSSIKQESFLRALQYNTLFRTFHPPLIDEKLVMIFDVRPVKLEFNKMENDYDVNIESPAKRKPYWTLLPLGAEVTYRDGYRYVMSGVFQLPLIEGKVPAAVLSSKAPFKDVLKMLGDRNSGLKLVDTSVLVKVVNPCLMELYEDAFGAWEDQLDTSFMIRMIRAASTAYPLKQEAFTYDNSKFMNTKTIEKQLNKVEDVKKVLKRVTAKFAEETQILHDAI